MTFCVNVPGPPTPLSPSADHWGCGVCSWSSALQEVWAGDRVLPGETGVQRFFVHAHHRQSDPALRTFAPLRISPSWRHLSVTLICESWHWETRVPFFYDTLSMWQKCRRLHLYRLQCTKDHTRFICISNLDGLALWQESEFSLSVSVAQLWTPSWWEGREGNSFLGVNQSSWPCHEIYAAVITAILGCGNEWKELSFVQNLYITINSESFICIPPYLPPVSSDPASRSLCKMVFLKAV